MSNEPTLICPACLRSTCGLLTPIIKTLSRDDYIRQAGERQLDCKAAVVRRAEAAESELAALKVRG